jgi:O-antigen/teichoic acid export membrane protein
MIKINGLIVFPVVLLSCFVSPYIMSLYGESFRSGWPTLVVVLLTSGLLAVQIPVAQIITATGKMWTGFAMNLGWAILFIVSTLLLINLGSLGLATARAIGYILHTTWVFALAIWLIRRRHRAKR